MCRTTWLVVVLLLGVIAGCGSDAAKKMGGGLPPSWPELDAVNEVCVTAIGMGMDMEGPAAAHQAASTPEFKQAVDAFESAPIPSEFATAARETAKTELVQNLRAFIEGGSDDELKALFEKIGANHQALTTP